MTLNESSNELKRRCNGLSNPNHVLEVALQMQKEIHNMFESQIRELEPVYEYIWIRFVDGIMDTSSYMTDEYALINLRQNSGWTKITESRRIKK